MGAPSPTVGGDDFSGQFRRLKCPEHGIDRVNQVEAGVDEGAIQVKDQELDLVRVERAIGLHLGRSGSRALGYRFWLRALVLWKRPAWSAPVGPKA